MNNKVSILGLVVIILGIIALGMGIVFVQQGFDREAWLVNTMTEEQIALPDGSGTIVDSAALAEAAGYRQGAPPRHRSYLRRPAR